MASWKCFCHCLSSAFRHLDMRMMFRLFLYTPPNGMDILYIYIYSLMLMIVSDIHPKKIISCESVFSVEKAQFVLPVEHHHPVHLNRSSLYPKMLILRPCHSLALHALEVGTAPSIWSFREEHAESLGAVGFFYQQKSGELGGTNPWNARLTGWDVLELAGK